MTAITMDLGGTRIKLGIVREGKLLAREILPAHSEAGIARRLPDIANAIRGMLQTCGLEAGQCDGIGMAIPGLIDSKAKRLLSVNDKYNDAVAFSFEQWAQDTFGLRLEMENDARAALIGELAHGAVRGETDVVLMIFGTGIGTAACMNGSVLRGRHFQAGILGGHIATDIHGEPCNCGNIGCLEAQASHWALPNAARRFFEARKQDEQLPSLSYESLIRAAEQGHEAAGKMLEMLLAHWGAGLVNLVHVYDPEVVLLSGGLMHARRLIVPRLEDYVHRHAWAPWGKVRFAIAEDPDTSVLLGAAQLLAGSAAS